MRHTFPTTHEGFSHHQCQLIPLHLGSRKKWTNAGCHQRWLKQEGQWQKATCIFFKAETRTKGEVRFPELEDVNMNIPISIFGAGREKTTLMFGLVVWGKNSDATVVIQIRKLKKEKERTVCNVDMDLSVFGKRSMAEMCQEEGVFAHVRRVRLLRWPRRGRLCWVRSAYVLGAIIWLRERTVGQGIRWFLRIESYASDSSHKIQ